MTSWDDSSVHFTFPGARHVVAVEADAEMAELAQQVVDANGLDQVVVLQGRVEVTTKMGVAGG